MKLLLGYFQQKSSNLLITNWIKFVIFLKANSLQCIYWQITAEHGVKMISVYTKDETQRQSLLHFIQDHIRIHPGQSMTNLNRDSIIFRVYFLIR